MHRGDLITLFVVKIKGGEQKQLFGVFLVGLVGEYR
jgi:hypothetical protein